jgi:3(or 17)beta-hydroxysteroid dehydrogenase
MGRVDGKVVLITGAAQGLGKADAEALAAEGATVVLSDVNVEGGEAATAAITAAGGAAFFVEQDVTDEAKWQEVLGAIQAEHGRLDVLVNNAGLVIIETPEECSLENFRLHSSVMTEGTFLGCKHAIPIMAAGGGGSIINMSSVASHLGYPIYFAYTAAKGAIRSMTKSIAIHCQTMEYNIRANTLHPGGIDTPMIDATAAHLGLDDKELLSAVGLGQPKDVADAVLFLASDESRFINGAEILIDNALTLQ